MNVMGGKYHESQDATFVRITFTAGAYTNDKITLPRLDAIAARDKSGKVWLESLSSIRISQSM